MSAAADADAASAAQYKKKWSRPSCLECRKSKRRCDSLLPQCSRCHKLGLVCEYKMAADIHETAEVVSLSEQPQHDAAVLWISSTLLFDSASVKCLLLQGMRAIDWPEWLNPQNDTQLEQTIFKLHDPTLPVISLLQMIVLIKGIAASFPAHKLSVASCVRVCNSLLQSIEQEMRTLPSRISARISFKNRSFETAASLVPWMTVLSTESAILGDALSSLHARLLRLSSTVVCFFFSQPPNAKSSPQVLNTKRSRKSPLGPDGDDSASCKVHDVGDNTGLTKKIKNALSRPWDVLSRIACAVVSQATDLIFASDQYRLAVSSFTVPPSGDGLSPADTDTSSLTHSDLDQIYMQISASADIDDASKCWYQIFVDCAKYLLCFRDSQHERAQAHIADATKSISLLRATNLNSVPTQIVPCFRSVVACCHSRINELGQAEAPVPLIRPLKAGCIADAEDHARQLWPILLGHVARIIGSVASVVATNSTQSALVSNTSATTRSCSLLQLKPMSCISESPPQRLVCPSGNQSDDGARSPLHFLSFPSSSTPPLRCRSPSTCSGPGHWEMLSPSNADDAVDVNEYLAADIFDCSSAAGIAASEGGSLLCSWWGAAAAVVSSTVANAAAQSIVEGNVLNFLD